MLAWSLLTCKPLWLEQMQMALTCSHKILKGYSNEPLPTMQHWPTHGAALVWSWAFKLNTNNSLMKKKKKKQVYEIHWMFVWKKLFLFCCFLLTALGPVHTEHIFFVVKNTRQKTVSRDAFFFASLNLFLTRAHVLHLWQTVKQKKNVKSSAVEMKKKKFLHFFGGESNMFVLFSLWNITWQPFQNFLSWLLCAENIYGNAIHYRIINWTA